MSGRLVSAVFESALPAWLKPYAAAFASFAADDGTKVYPTVRRIARMVGRCERSARYAVMELRRLRVLEVVTPARRYQANRYVFQAAALPQLGDAEQLVLLTFQAFQQRDREKRSRNDRFPQFAQASTCSPLHPRGATHCTRSVIDPSISTRTGKTRLRAAKAGLNARKLGT